MPDTNPPPTSTSAPPPASEHAAPPASTTGSHAVVPDPSDNHPIIRASKWMAAVLGIAGGLVAVVTGIWKVGNLIDDLNDARTELASLHSSFNEYQEDTRRRDEIQEQILVNLRIAVASIQAVAEYRVSRTLRTDGDGITEPMIAVEPPVRPTHPGTRPVRPPVTTALPHPTADVEPPTAHVGITTRRVRTSPELAALMRSLPPLPSPPPPLSGGGSSELMEIAHDSDTADVALERAEILQAHLEEHP